MNEKINNDAGVVYVRVTQPTGKHFNLMDRIGVCIDKAAIPFDQTAELTNKVVDFVKS